MRQNDTFEHATKWVHLKILIIQSAFIGDVVLATALIEKLRAYYPDAEIHFLLRNGNQGLLAGHPAIQKIWVWDKKQFKYINLMQLLFSIRRERFDLLVNCQRFAASGFLTAFSAAKIKAGYAKNPFSFLFTEKFPHVIGGIGDKEFLHETARNQQLIARITDAVPALPRLYPATADFDSVKKYKSECYVTICPASVWFTKQLPTVKWVELIAEIPSTHTIYLLGGSGDRKLCDDIRRSSPGGNICNLAGELTFLQTAALMKDAAMNYVNDSAPLHFASAVNAKVTAVFCSTIPQFGFGPLSTVSHVLEINDILPCRPCGLHGLSHCPEKHFQCAAAIRMQTFLEG